MATFNIPVLLRYSGRGPNASGSYKELARNGVGRRDLLENLVQSKPVEFELSNPALEFAAVAIRQVSTPLYSPDASDATISQTVNNEVIRKKTKLIADRMKLSGMEDKLVSIISVPTLGDDQQATLASVVEGIAARLPDREAIAAAGRKRRSPSSGATVSELMKTQTPTHLDAVYNYRPLHLAPPPIIIYRPAFARFAYSISQPIGSNIYTPKEVETAREFIELSSKLYVDEPSRQRAITDAFLEPDGVIRMDTSFEGFRPVVAITEVKNEIGTGGCDPRAQAECAYVAIYTSPEAKPIRNICCCPALLLAIAGPYIAVSGAAFADQLISQPFTDYMSVIPLSPLESSSMSETILSVARLFRALKHCVTDLKTYYGGLQAMKSVSSSRLKSGAQRTSPRTSSNNPVDTRLSGVPKASSGTPSHYVGPSFSTYTDLNGQQVELKYVARLAAQYSSKAVFLADARVPDKAAFRVVVKFTEAYGKHAHKVAHEGGFAPKLHHCEKVNSVGMWVVVMDFVASGSDSVRLSSVAESLRNAVKTLHDKGFVFGDLREPNILVTKEGKVQLIDFDWCGRVEEARYPYDIAMTGDHGWHADVQPGGLIAKEHDAHMFERLTEVQFELTEEQS
ncbi:uncharacterized protein B0H18DRAFT_1116814 [Fomitopsis serialis]|uniref:uncharacterized protein n=1 Tax=Fomitopsis serialis TaxID=139415 RepID=UPI002008D4D2|nr:uncharacterized protein B0H18DRAFT_1116814 [Neoantrodia serialis]KAH9930695.1 hypothetical protein B0H18DRAFT_1116814 [Neoantrodia serialis]